MTPTLLRAAAAMLAAFLALPASLANAGTVEHVSMAYSATHPVPHFHYSGTVETGDLDALARLYFDVVTCRPELLPADGGNCAVLTMHSPGGNYLEGLLMADWLRANAVATLVEANQSCHSACAMAFMGGSGHSSDPSIGAYIDRVIEPQGVVGFHAPYRQSDQVEALIAERGAEAILGESRQAIALMIEELVNWNVDPQVIAGMVVMGPGDTFDIASPETLYLARTDLPRAPLHLWKDDPVVALRNACVTLLADYQKSTPLGTFTKIPTQFEHNIGTNQFGQPLSGFRLNESNPLRASICAVPTEQAMLDGDADIALFSGPGIDGSVRAMHSFFHRPDAWSTIGTGSVASMRIFRKGTIVRAFVDPFADLRDVPRDLQDHILAGNFLSQHPDGAVYLPIFPEMPTSLTYVGQTDMMDVYEEGNATVHVQVGNAQLFMAIRESVTSDNANYEISHVSFGENAFVIIGKYAQSERRFSWIAFKTGDEAAIFRIETARMDGAAPDEADQLIVNRLHCAISYQGLKLQC